jgi:hypothetical protein
MAFTHIIARAASSSARKSQNKWRNNETEPGKLDSVTSARNLHAQKHIPISRKISRRQSQGDRMSLGKYWTKCSPSLFVNIKTKLSPKTKSTPKYLTSSVIVKKRPHVSHCLIGENSPNLVTLSILSIHSFLCFISRRTPCANKVSHF